MHISRKMLALLLVALLSIVLVSQVFASENETEPTICVTSACAVRGDQVTVEVEIRNNPGINTFTLGFSYDEQALKLVDLQKDCNLPGEFVYGKKAVWLNAEDTQYNGTILHLTFQVLDAAAYRDYPVKVICDTPGNICNYAEESVAFKFIPGTIQVMEYKLGDVDNDKAINEDDLRLLLRHVAKIEPLSDDQIVYADINGDKSIDAVDVTELAKYLEGIA